MFFAPLELPKSRTLSLLCLEVAGGSSGKSLSRWSGKGEHLSLVLSFPHVKTSQDIQIKLEVKLAVSQRRYTVDRIPRLAIVPYIKIAVAYGNCIDTIIVMVAEDKTWLDESRSMFEEMLDRDDYLRL